MIDKLLEKLNEQYGITNYGQLDEEEKKQYDRWMEKLGTPDPTIEDMKKMIRAEKELVDKELYKYDNGREKDLFYKSTGRMLMRLEAMIGAGERTRSDAMSGIQKAIKDMEKNDNA